MEPSNTLLVLGITDNEQSEQLRDLVSKIDLDIAYWVLLKSFTRVIAVFETTEQAVTAKEHIETLAAGPNWSHVKVHFTRDTDIHSDMWLKLPDRGRLWLISPPPSPPVGWEPRPESEPNKDAHVDGSELHRALELAAKAPSAMTLADKPVLSLDTSEPKTITRRFTLRESSPVQPSIVIEWDDDGDGSDGESTPYITNQRTFPKTEAPPVPH